MLTSKNSILKSIFKNILLLFLFFSGFNIIGEKFLDQEFFWVEVHFDPPISSTIVKINVNIKNTYLESKHWVSVYYQGFLLAARQGMNVPRRLQIPQKIGPYFLSNSIFWPNRWVYFWVFADDLLLVSVKMWKTLMSCDERAVTWVSQAVSWYMGSTN